MNKNRLFNLVVVVSLAALAALTISQAVATDQLVSAASDDKVAASSQISGPCTASGEEHALIHTAYDPKRGVWVTYMGDTPTGVDGGLIELLSNRSSCSK